MCSSVNLLTWNKSVPSRTTAYRRQGQFSCVQTTSYLDFDDLLVFTWNFSLMAFIFTASFRAFLLSKVWYKDILWVGPRLWDGVGSETGPGHDGIGGIPKNGLKPFLYSVYTYCGHNWLDLSSSDNLFSKSLASPNSKFSSTRLGRVFSQYYLMHYNLYHF